jgi:hypothetical protein
MFMANILCALSFENRSNTLFWIDADWMQPVPFDQEKSRALVIVPTTISHVNKGELKEVLKRLERPRRPDGTVTLRNWSLPTRTDIDEYGPRRVTTTLEAGVVTIRADRAALKVLSEWLFRQAKSLPDIPSTYEEVDRVRQFKHWHTSHWQIDGEIQYYRNFALISRYTASVRSKVIDKNPDLPREQVLEEVYSREPAWKFR